VQILTNDLRGPAKNTCYLRKRRCGWGECFSPYTGSRLLPFS